MRKDRYPGLCSPGPRVGGLTQRSATWFPSKEYQKGDLGGDDRGFLRIVECDSNKVPANADLGFILKYISSSLSVYARWNRDFSTCRNEKGIDVRPGAGKGGKLPICRAQRCPDSKLNIK
jgi:hypothetical protein